MYLEGHKKRGKNARRCRCVCAIFPAYRANFLLLHVQKHSLNTCASKFSTGTDLLTCFLHYNLNSASSIATLAYCLRQFETRFCAIFSLNFSQDRQIQVYFQARKTE